MFFLLLGVPVAILTAEEYATFAGLPSVTPLATYQALCEAAGQAIEDYLGRPLEKMSRTEFYSANGTKTLALRAYPVWSVTEVRYDPRAWFGGAVGAFDATTILTEGVDYTLQYTDTVSKTGLLIRITGVWPEFPRRREIYKLTQDLVPQWGDVKVTYVGGYDPVPSPIKLACAQLVTRARDLVKLGAPKTGERLGDWSYQLAHALRGNPEIGSLRQLLARYRQPW